MWIFGQNPQADTDAVFQDPHLSDTDVCHSPLESIADHTGCAEWHRGPPTSCMVAVVVTVDI